MKLHIPRWGVLLFDLFLSAVSVALAHLLRFNFSIAAIDYFYFPEGIFFLLVLRLWGFLEVRTYYGIIFHTSFEDAMRIFVALLWGTLIMGLALNPLMYYLDGHFLFPYSLLIIEFFLTASLLVSYRAFVKMLYFRYVHKNEEEKKALVFGAGPAGLRVKNLLAQVEGTRYKVAAFIDDDPGLEKKSMQGVDIFPSELLPRLLKTTSIDVLIFSHPDVPPARRQKVLDLCLRHGVKVLNVPPAEHWVDGKLSFRQMREMRIEDLLERAPIELKPDHLHRALAGKVILISGAAGSIGSELVRQLVSFEPERLVLIDQAETPLHELELELRNRLKFNRFEVVIGDVRKESCLRKIFLENEPQIVYHAAAYKHVPMMERHPQEAVLANVGGTHLMADLSVEYGVKKFVLVSTDKAVNPTNIMGATKRLAEIYVQSLDRDLRQKGVEHPRFVTTRFGNVLGSNGSVIPLFKKQIEAGGPVTVTHPEITRYFMTIPEACRLVLEASVMGKGGEIYVFDMGRSVKIVDLARKMILLAGLIPGQDIEIRFTGLRPGEKLYEELLASEESTLPTHHEKILIARVREYPFEKVREGIENLLALYETQDKQWIVSALKALVPSFKSQNSIYEELDKKT